MVDDTYTSLESFLTQTTQAPHHLLESSIIITQKVFTSWRQLVSTSKLEKADRRKLLKVVFSELKSRY